MNLLYCLKEMVDTRVNACVSEKINRLPFVCEGRVVGDGKFTIK